MNAERFAALCEIYGADLRRWPAHEREAAQRLVEGGLSHDAGESAAARVALRRARAVDALLDGYDVEAPSRALAERIMASAPRPAWTWSRARLWWSGAGLAGVGIAGAALGALLFSMAGPTLLGHGSAGDELTTAFGQIAGLNAGVDSASLDDLEGLLQ